ncbi:M23 family metallopeptidase [Luteithermobacter gelatinilyticus]|uniref:M23 family metallopeptidase n=1 Tax=Luteithermobacter gelatinilyticus TaxID=2582913 RepID=UPI0011057ED9|nr:M23 family metallopeptidase [Luteithermobacter gelatinilyticus]
MRGVLCFGLCLVWLFFAGAVNAATEAIRPEFRVPSPLVQGGFYVGKAPAGSEVIFKGKKLRLTPAGYFPFGLNWKEGSTVTFTVIPPDGERREYRFPVQEHKYDVSVIDGLPPKMVTPPPEVRQRIANDAARVREARSVLSDLTDFGRKMIWPVKGRVSGHFGNHRILNGTPKSPHTGMDIAAPKGTPVVAPLGGIVIMVADLYYTGNTVIIDHGYGVSTVYCHLDSVAVRERQKIGQGDPLGTVGMTGRATGPHLHWGMNWEGERLNPELSLPAS